MMSPSEKMKRQASPDYATAKAAHDLFFAWSSCPECQYNTYVCVDHIGMLEVMFIIIGKEYNINVVDFQVQDEEDKS